MFPSSRSLSGASLKRFNLSPAIFTGDFNRDNSRVNRSGKKISTALPSQQQQLRMESGGEDNKTAINSNPNVNKFQQLVNNDSTGGWEKCWEQELTPWDLGRPTPVILNLLQADALPKGRVLIPGCGGGHDVVAVAGPERYVVGLDVSETAIKKAKELFSSSQNANHFAFIMEDFFSWNSPSLFDLIFDYTFFCAIEPSMRPAWASRVRDLLKEDGELITLMFPIDDHVGGPPYKVSLADYEEVLCPIGFKASSVIDNELAVGARKGREKLARWKRSLKQSHL